jgi:hypothetical protein
MESAPIGYLELAEELLQVAQEFATSIGVESNVYHFGTKSVQVLAKSSSKTSAAPSSPKSSAKSSSAPSTPAPNASASSDKD